jgi:chemotaxis protein methyltransferase CheR
MKRELFEKYRRLIHDASGIALTDTKDALVSARISRRIRELGLASEEAYYDFVADTRHAEEIGILIDLISTNVTRFFRDIAHFEVLKSLCTTWQREHRSEIRIWSAGCSSGEEPYSIAMTTREHLPTYCSAKILATDISMRVLTQAHAGAFADDKIRNVPEAYVQKYFLRSSVDPEKRWVVHPALRKQILFRQLNFIRNPLPVKGLFDVIFCRNVMIYFDAQLRQRLVRRFYDLLKPGGIFFISHTESLAGIAGNFSLRQPSVFIKPDLGGQLAHANANVAV